MLVFWDEKLVLLSVPKTGTTALQAALAPQAAIVMRYPPQLKHSPVTRYRRFLQPLLQQGGGATEVETMALVRNPIDWLGSWYRYRARDEIAGQPNSTQGISFDDFVTEYTRGKPAPFANVGSQAKFLTLGNGSVGVTHLFRYEAMDQVLAFLADRLGRDAITLKQRNVSPQMPLTLSQHVQERLRARCEAEFAIWQAARH